MPRTPRCASNIDALLDEYTNAQAAHFLNERGLRTGAGEAFDSASVQWVRLSAKLESLKERLLEARMLSGYTGSRSRIRRPQLDHP